MKSNKLPTISNQYIFHHNNLIESIKNNNKQLAYHSIESIDLLVSPLIRR